MAKKLSENQKEQIGEFFILGDSITKLSKDFNVTNATIIRNLKKHLGAEKFEEYFKKSKLDIKKAAPKDKEVSVKSKDLNKQKYKDNVSSEDSLNIDPNDFNQAFNSFTEIAPLNFEIENATQKDLSSIPISDVNFPKLVYMIVDKKIELDIKFLKDFPDWQFLAEEELNRKTIQIYNDMKVAKKFCVKEQKVIKVPNTDVFKIVARLLVSRGITRIVNEDKLIAL